MINKRGKFKKGQITIFIILAILIISGIVVFFAFRARGPVEKEVVIPQQVLPIVDSVQSCVETNLKEGVMIVALQGGYIIPPSNALEINSSYVAYWYDKGSKKVPTIEEIQNQISDYIRLTLPTCYPNLDTQKFQINRGNISVQTKIDKNAVSTFVSFPFTARAGNTSYELDKKYSAEYAVNLGDMYDVGNKIILKEIADQNSIDMSYLSIFNYAIDISYSGNNIVIYSIEDNLKDGGAIILRFASKLK